jgi:hypothetical protein
MLNIYSKEQELPNVTEPSPHNLSNTSEAKTPLALDTNSSSFSLERQSPSLEERSASPSIKIPVPSPKQFAPLRLAFSFREPKHESILSLENPDNGKHPIFYPTTRESGSPFSTYLMLDKVLSSRPPNIPCVVMKKYLTDEIKGYFNEEDLEQDASSSQSLNSEEDNAQLIDVGEDIFHLEPEPHPIRP